MQFTLSTIVACAAFLNVASAHLYMAKPQMFASHKQADGYVLNPLDMPGDATLNPFPCQGGTADESVPEGNSYQLGEDAVLQIKGSAVHSGGSGQVVISYTFPPSANPEDWHVLTSYQGSHPIAAPGNLPDGDDNSIPDMTFKIHESLPKGKAIVAWNWFNKSGNREHYMKCATVSIGGSTDSVSNADLSSLPTMFNANSEGSSCAVPEGVDSIKFKNPGTSVFGEGVTPVDCDSSKAGSGSGGSAPVEETVPDNESTEEPAVEVEAPVVIAPVEEAPASAPQAPSGGACTDGSITCNGDGTWSMCGGGALINMGALAAGTTCNNGAIAKRNVRFSPSHINRRRHN